MANLNQIRKQESWEIEFNNKTYMIQQEEDINIGYTGTEVTNEDGEEITDETLRNDIIDEFEKDLELQK